MYGAITGAEREVAATLCVDGFALGDPTLPSNSLRRI